MLYKVWVTSRNGRPVPLDERVHEVLACSLAEHEARLAADVSVDQWVVEEGGEA